MHLHVEVEGNGEPLVLLHAGVADLRMWADQVPSFAARYTVIRYDAQGFGRSPMAAEPQARAEDLYDVLRGVGVDRAHVLGISMGGAAAIDFALIHPAMVGTLVPVAAGLSGYQGVDPWLDEQNRLEDAAVARGDLDEATRVDMQTWLAGPKRRLADMDAALVERAAGLARAVIEHDAERKRAPGIDPPAAGRLAELHLPTLVVVGDADVQAIVHMADVLASGITGASKLVLPNAAHLLNMEYPAQFNQGVLDFLAQHPLA
jgi:3-oxoadipate enol-lactonase